MYHDADITTSGLCDFLARHREQCPALHDLVIGNPSSLVWKLSAAMDRLRRCTTDGFLWWSFWYDVHRVNTDLWHRHPDAARLLDPLDVDSIAFRHGSFRTADDLTAFLSGRGLHPAILPALQRLPVQEVIKRTHS